MRRQVTEYTCDICGCEVDESILIPKEITFRPPDGVYTVKLVPYDDYDICIYCFIKAINKLDPRTKEVGNE